ncbi:uncharacterized protein LOC129928327 isoform X2 [Biomphalaria glabrata]|uniref:Uncharacterized protein LOC129928327 isoform X2 n=1 Tax=Biomphalaria glabrata TaxID=6526 RepID=A0A9W3BF69_BIOGL|nr:uncharacterized protein LOC129928327 isoform X2 [Biomphalaria glabrata]
MFTLKPNEDSKDTRLKSSGQPGDRWGFRQDQLCNTGQSQTCNGNIECQPTCSNSRTSRIDDDQFYGNHETQEFKEEADLHRHYANCTKNPGHKEFINIDKFTLNHLPANHRDQDLYDLIKAMAGLTVRVNLEKTSPNRPEFWPNTTKPYPFFKGSRSGTGMIWNVEKRIDEEYFDSLPGNRRIGTLRDGLLNMFDVHTFKQTNGQVKVSDEDYESVTDDDEDYEPAANEYDGNEPVPHGDEDNDHVMNDDDDPNKEYTVCWCNKCQRSQSPSRVWWELETYTATHVVFDAIEASGTSLKLFYDRDESPKVIIDKVKVVDAKPDTDLCRLRGVTCDENVGPKLLELWQEYYDVWERVFDKYDKTRNVDRLTFIVSHPHGCPKQVSIGQWKEKQENGRQRKRFTYTTCTCPGSSGAFVHCVGFGGWWANQLVHTGCTEQSGFNYSGIGDVV